MKTLLVAVAALVIAAPAAAAVNLVTNGDFSTGDFTGWSQFGNTGFTFVSGGVAVFGPVGSTGGIVQSLSGVGSSGTLEFDLSHDGGTYNSFDVTYGSTTLNSFVNAASFGTTHYTYAISGDNALTFTFRQDPAYYRLDNVVVTSNVPEPAAWAMLIAGFGLTGAVMRRRRSVAIAA
jgi:hypothetical protein